MREIVCPPATHISVSFFIQRALTETLILALTILSCLLYRYSHTHSNLKHFNNKEIREAVLSKEESFDGNANTGTDNSLLFVTQILTFKPKTL